MKLGLTKEQLIERRRGIGGSDAIKIINGEWYELWLDKTGRKEPEDLSRNLAVQMGNATEEFNAYWYGLTTNWPVTARGQARKHYILDFLRCTLDGLVEDRSAVWQAKHVSGREPIEAVTQRYLPQVTHEMVVCGLSRAVLSVFMGTNIFHAVEIELDEFFAATYIDKCREFWSYVESDRPPSQGAPLPVPAAAVPIPTKPVNIDDLLVNKDKTPLPNWVPLIQTEIDTWSATEEAAGKFKKATDAIKVLLPEDVSPCVYGDVTIARDGRGVSIKKPKAKKGKK